MLNIRWVFKKPPPGWNKRLQVGAKKKAGAAESSSNLKDSWGETEWGKESRAKEDKEKQQRKEENWGRGGVPKRQQQSYSNRNSCQRWRWDRENSGSLTHKNVSALTVPTMALWGAWGRKEGQALLPLLKLWGGGRVSSQVSCPNSSDFILANKLLPLTRLWKTWTFSISSPCHKCHLFSSSLSSHHLPSTSASEN